MKTLIYALAPLGTGTKRLAYALTDLGLEGGHEVSGMSSNGSVRDVQSTLTKIRNRTYPIQGVEEGDTGDNILADAFFQYHDQGRAIYNNRFDSVVWNVIERFLIGGGYFVDINSHLADWWPCVERVAHSTRKIHMTMDGRTWVRKLMSSKSYTEESTHYGSIHNINTIYPPWMNKKLGPFENACWYWNFIHEWFLNANAPRFKVENFNDRKTQLEILYELLGEDTEKYEKDFTLSDPKYDKADSEIEREFPPYEEWPEGLKTVFWSICHKTMCKLDYA